MEQRKVIPMVARMVLASASPVRLALLRNACVPVEAVAPRVDEEALRASLLAEGARPREMADVLAEAKARKIADRHPGAWVIGCDQILDLDGSALGKAADKQDLLAQLARLSGNTHHLHSAVVLYEAGHPVWRYVGSAKLVMHPLSEAYRQGYVARNWDSIRHCVGGYKLEEEGVRLFSAIEGDYFTVLGLPLVPLLAYLAQRKALES